MVAIAVRELIVAARCRAVAVVACGIAATLTGFVLVWSPGVSLLAPMNLYEQARLLLWVVLTSALPWIAVRCAPDGRRALVLISGLTGLSPATLVIGKIGATFALLAALIFTALPALVFAQQSAAIPVTAVLGDLVPLMGLALFVAVSSTALVLFLREPLVVWLLATAVVAGPLLGGALFIPDTQAAGLACALAGMAGASWMSWQSGRSLCHLRDDDAE